MSNIRYLSTLLIAQLFYAFAITVFVSSLAAVTSLTPYALVLNNVPLELEDVGEQVDSSFNQQIDLPLVNIGSLVFFSGNLLADFMLNFVTAVPGMVNVLIGIFFLFFPIDAGLQSTVQAFVLILGTVLYVIGIMSFVASLRSGGAPVSTF